MTDDILQKLKRHPSFLYNQDLLDICRPLLFLNISFFSYVKIVDNNKSMSAICSHPDFLKNYVINKYYDIDIHNEKYDSKSLKFLIWDVVGHHKKITKMLQDAAEYQVKHIFTIIDDNHGEYFHFGTDKSNISMNQFYINNLDLLISFSSYFKEIINKSNKFIEAYDINFPLTIEGNNLNSLGFVLDNNDENKNKFINSIKHGSHESHISNLNYKKLYIDENIRLTKKEIDCIPFLISGYSAKMIAKEFGLSYRTIEDHIASMRDKLSAKNKTELVSKLILTRYI